MTRSCHSTEYLREWTGARHGRKDGVATRSPDFGSPEMWSLDACSRAISKQQALAIDAIPFEHPKLAVTAIIPDGGDRFAERLEKALARSKPILELRANGSQFEISPPVAVRRR